MINTIKTKLNQAWNWIKRKVKAILIWIGILGIATAATVIDLNTNEVSIEKLQQKYEQSIEVKAKYQLDGASLKMIIKDDPKDMIRVQIGENSDLLGGVKDFTPSVKISRWDEVSFKIKPKGLDNVATKDKTLSFKENKIKFGTPEMDYEMYEYEDGYKYVWYLKKKPDSNIIEFEIESTGLDFFYQPELTQEEIDNGAFRPENVVGSYAVYTSEQKTNWVGGKEYKAGKVAHIYRPHLYDAEGKECWGILHIENGIYSVEIPQDFLDKAVYPIRSNDTFGYTSIGGSEMSIGEDHLGGCLFTSPADIDVADSITFYSKSVTTYRYWKGLIILDSNLQIIDNGIGTPVKNTNTYSWDTSSFETPPTLSPSTGYELAFIDGATKTYFKYDVGETDQYKEDYSNDYGAPQNPDSWTVEADRKVSIYATYTPAAAEEAEEPQMQVIIVN